MTATTTFPEVMKYRVGIEFLMPCLGTAPSDPNLYRDHIIGQAIQQLLQKARTEEDKGKIEMLRAARIDHELSLLPAQNNAALMAGQPETVIAALSTNKPVANETDQKGKTVFRRSPTGLILPGYMVKGFFKSAAESCATFAQPNSRIDKYLYVAERELPMMRNGKQITEADYDFTRPLRTTDQYGVSRVCLAVSEVIEPPCQLSFSVMVLPKGFGAKSSEGKFTKDSVRQWCEYGCFCGLGQWRNGNFGAFKINSFEEAPVSWSEAVQARITSLQQGAAWNDQLAVEINKLEIGA